jgi:hypothetical protein
MVSFVTIILPNFFGNFSEKTLWEILAVIVVAVTALLLTLRR